MSRASITVKDLKYKYSEGICHATLSSIADQQTPTPDWDSSKTVMHGQLPIAAKSKAFIF